MARLRRLSSLPVLALAAVLCGLPTRASALDLIQIVSRQQARELGITVRARPSANDDVVVQVEYRPTGPKREFKRADLEVTQGKKRLVGASLVPKPLGPDGKYFEFYIDPANLANASLTLVVWQDPITGQGYQLNMKEFVTPPASR